jgi:hypothetical protein
MAISFALTGIVVLGPLFLAKGAALGDDASRQLARYFRAWGKTYLVLIPQ